MRDARDPTSPSAHSTHVTGKGASGEIFYSKGWNEGLSTTSSTSLLLRGAVTLQRVYGPKRNS